MKYLIVGLGNIGDEYANTRHNIGFIVLDALAQDAGKSFEPSRYASVASLKHRGKSLLLIKPSTYMNLSGKAVRYWMEKEKVDTDHMLVIADDIALPLGQLRMKKKGGDGGHNGLSSIIETIGTQEFPRLRVGIGNDYSRGYQSDYVLGRWSAVETALMIPRVNTAAEMVKSFVTIGIDKTMTAYNKPFGPENS